MCAHTYLKGVLIMRIKKLLTLLLTLILSLSFSVPCFASEDEAIIFKTISDSELPAGITPMEFKSEAEAKSFILASSNNESSYQMISSIDMDKSLSSNTIISTSTVASGTDATIDVDSVTVAYGIMGTIYLKAHYGTSRPGKAGTITYINPYTEYTGFTYGFDWKESICSYSIRSGGKDAYIYAGGVLDWYLLIEGLLRVYSQPVSLGRICYLAR